MLTSAPTATVQAPVPDRGIPETVIRSLWKAAELRRIVAELTAGVLEPLDAEYRLIDLGIEHHAAERLVDTCQAAAHAGGAW
jgi:hypothetical protein